METRRYNMSDPRMFEFSGTYRLIFLDDMAEFVAFDPDFDSPFEVDWRLSLIASMEVDTDELRTDIQEGLTDRVLADMAAGRVLYHEVKYFALKAFGSDRSSLHRFGLDNYGDVGTDQIKMAMLLKDMHKAATDAVLGPQILAAGLTPAKVTALNSLYESLNTANFTQEHFIAKSPEATNERVIKYNSTWAFAEKVNAASKVLYINNVVKRNLYTFPATGNTADDFNVTGNVNDSVTGNPIAGAKVKLVELDIQVLTDESGNYGIEGVPAGGYTVEMVANGYTLLSQALTVPASGVVTLNGSLTPAP